MVLCINSKGATPSWLAKKVVRSILRSAACCKSAAAQSAELRGLHRAACDGKPSAHATLHMLLAEAQLQAGGVGGGAPPDRRVPVLPGAREAAADTAAPSAGGGAMAGDPRSTNTGHFRVPLDFDALPAGAFTLVRKLATGIDGDVFEYQWCRQGADAGPVAVKKLRRGALEGARRAETGEWRLHLSPSLPEAAVQDPLSEIGILRYLGKQPDMSAHVLRMHGCFVDEHFAWLVTELAEGGELFDVVASGPLSPAQARRYTWQLLQAVAYLHQHHIGHRDLSLENILLKGGAVKVIDFGMAVLTHSASGAPLRYFRAIGKTTYMAPECYVPAGARSTVITPAAAAPGDVTQVRVGDYLCEVRIPPHAVPGRFCSAEVWGYTVPPADVFSSGVCLFIMGYQFPPWPCARLSACQFAYAYDRGDGGLEELLRHYKQPPLPDGLMVLLARMLHPRPSARPSAAECLASPCFEAEVEFG